MLRSFTINIITHINRDHNFCAAKYVWFEIETLFHSETLLIGYISLLTKKNKSSNVHSRYKREYINYKFGSLANRLTQYKAHQMQDKKDYTVQVKKNPRKSKAHQVKLLFYEAAASP